MNPKKPYTKRERRIFLEMSSECHFGSEGICMNEWSPEVKDGKADSTGRCLCQMGKCPLLGGVR